MECFNKDAPRYVKLQQLLRNCYKPEFTGVFFVAGVTDAAASLLSGSIGSTCHESGGNNTDKASVVLTVALPIGRGWQRTCVMNRVYRSLARPSTLT